MAFTREEFRVGSLAAWGSFIGLLLAAEIILAVVTDIRSAGMGMPFFGLLPLMLLVSLIVAAPVSGLALLLAAPLVRRLAWRLRTIRSIWIHVGVFALLGAVVGALTITVMQIGFAIAGSASDLALFGRYCLLAAAFTAASTTIGWGTAMRAARRWDRRRRVVASMRGFEDGTSGEQAVIERPGLRNT
ncbi:hypothetical protein Q9R19_06495 [Microbacterium sp. ARD32]|uniref:hypothetical protein n=1 Tax=Microbacterium sp. ARD32 TaxID=2962577 RepID=UPI002881418B|nr:hypothetical protein [Microbacterium sp. ARD32]MDT0157268.1 hypothetical protein [Microbacterium sp. ARD32]